MSARERERLEVRQFCWARSRAFHGDHVGARQLWAEWCVWCDDPIWYDGVGTWPLIECEECHAELAREYPF